MYQTIDLRNKRTTKYGAFSAYFRLSKYRGVKVYGAGEGMSQYGECVEFKKDVYFGAVKDDFKFIKRIACSIVPKVYRIVYVRLQGNWYPGIVMEHVNGMCAGDLPSNSRLFKKTSSHELMDKIANKFCKVTGYWHEDLHSFNVIVNRRTGKFKVIDLTVDTATPSDGGGEYYEYA